MHKRGLTCWDQGPSLRLPGLWMSKRRASLLKGRGERRAQDEPRARLEAEIQSVGEVPITKASSVRKFFTPHHRESTERPQQQQLQIKEQRGPGSWAEAYEEEHHSEGGGKRLQAAVADGETAKSEQRLRDEPLGSF